MHYFRCGKYQMNLRNEIARVIIVIDRYQETQDERKCID
jgi:hypothetical protein